MTMTFKTSAINEKPIEAIAIFSAECQPNTFVKNTTRPLQLFCHFNNFDKTAVTEAFNRAHQNVSDGNKMRLLGVAILGENIQITNGRISEKEPIPTKNMLS